jgi:putative peptide zinc metalloprotease protein
MERPTFSPFWHRVRALHPRLRPHVEITRQHYRGRRWHVVHDPSSNQFYRLSPVAFDFVSTLDGVRTVEESWKISLSKFGDASPTQNEIIELLSQLYNTNLLSVDTPPETEQLLARGRERTKKRLQQQAIGIMYFRIRLFNPDRLLSAVEPIIRPVLNQWGFAVWALFVAWSFLSILPQWPRLKTGFDNYLLNTSNPAEWGSMLAVFITIKLIHEFGHGIICKRFGGQVPEFGTMLLVLVPAPYVDASASWAFPSKWQRAAVGAGGMIFELFVAAIAAHVWLHATDGTFVHRAAFYAMVSASVATILFNANPLMRFDGYFIMADLLEVPNLMQRSQQMVNHLVQKHIFRFKNQRPPSTQPSEQAILLSYGVLAGIYRIFLFFAITLYILGQFFIVGVFLAIWTAGAWFLLPLGKLAHWLATSSTVAEHRPRTVALTLAIAAAIALLVGVLPLPDWRRAEGVVESLSDTGVFFQTDGFVTEARVRPGDRVKTGDVLVRLTNYDLERAQSTLIARAEEARVRKRAARADDNAGAAAVLVIEKQVELFTGQLAEIRKRIAALEVRAPHDGSIVAADPQLAVGAFVKRGDPLCKVVDDRRLRVTATLLQGEGAWFNEVPREQYAIRMRYASDIPTIVEGGNARSPSAALHELPHPSLTPRGGGTIEADPQDQHGRLARRATFNVYIDPISDMPVGKPGEHVWIRFTLPSKSLAAQVIDRVQKMLQGRVNL